MLAFGFGNPADWAIIFVIALILFGPKKLPELGQQLGQALREFRKIADDVTGATDSVRSEVRRVSTPSRCLSNATTIRKHPNRKPPPRRRWKMAGLSSAGRVDCVSLRLCPKPFGKWGTRKDSVRCYH
jgi:sec-independent protein translocase protein TatA